VIIMMENHGLHPVLNDQTDMPYLNSLWRGGTSLDFPHDAALAHPSLPNYLGITSGFTQATSDAVHPASSRARRSGTSSPRGSALRAYPGNI